MTFRPIRELSFSRARAISRLLLASALAPLLSLSCEGFTLTCEELQNCEGGAGNGAGGRTGGSETGGMGGEGNPLADGGAGGGGTGAAPSSGGEGGVSDPGTGGQGMVATPGIELTAPEVIRVRQGAKVRFDVVVERKGGFDGELTVSILGLPEGVVSEPIALEGDEEQASFEVAATSDAEQTTRRTLSVVVRGADGLEEKSELRLIVAGAPGTLDESFGDGGVLRSGSVYSNVTVAADESIWVTGTDGDGALRIYRFDQNGKASWNVEVEGLSWYGVVSSGERLLARSYGVSGANEDLLRAFYLDGSLDQNFAENGILSLEGSLGYQDQIVVASDGGYFVANSLNTFRLNADGTSTADFEYFYEHDSDNRPSTFAFDSKGRILGSGRINDSSRYFLNRARPDGRLDASFGATGTAVSDTGLVSASAQQFTQAVRILVRPDDSSILLAISNPRKDGFDVDSELAILSFGRDGDLDSGFGTSGKIVLAPVGDIYEAFRVSSGEFLVLYAPGLGSYHWLVRYSDRGALDETFGEGGQVHFEDLLAEGGSPSGRSDVACDAVTGRVIATIPGPEFGYIASYWL